MNFTATAIVKEIDKLNEKLFKVLLEDERHQHIVVNVPLEKEQELAVGSKVSIWGNVSAFNYQSKWYNNLFAQTVVPEEKKYLLIKKDEENGKEFFKQIQFGSEPFNLEFVRTNYPDDFQVETKPEIAGDDQTGASNVELQALEKIETEGLGLLQRLLLRRSASAKLEDQFEGENMSAGFYNLEYWHLQNALSQKKVQIQEGNIIMNENFSFFSKGQGAIKLPLIYFYEQGEMIE